MQQGHFLFELTVAVLALAALAINLVILARISRMLQQLRATVDTVRQQIQPVIHDAHQVTQDAHQITQDVRTGLSAILNRTQASVAMITTTTEEIAQMAHEQATELRALAQDTVLSARNQVERLDDLVSRTTSRVDQTAAIVQTEVLQPVHELHCFVVGVRRALQVFLTRKRSPVDRVYQDEELFI